MSSQAFSGPVSPSSAHTSSFGSLPKTATGKWTAAMAVVFCVLALVTFALPLMQPAMRGAPSTGMLMLPVGAAAGVLSVVALTRKHERSWMVWLGAVAGMVVIVALASELLIPH